MKTTFAHRITAYTTLTVLAVILALATADARVTVWARRTRDKGEVVSYVIVVAGLALIAIGVVAYLGPKVQEYLNRIQ